MFHLNLMEIVAADQQSDRLHEAEIARLANEGKSSRTTSLKFTVAAGGIGLIALMIVQMVI